MLGQLDVKAVVGVVALAELAEIAGRGKFCRMGGGQGSSPGYGFFLSILNLLLELEALEAEVFIAEDLVGAGGTWSQGRRKAGVKWRRSWLKRGVMEWGWLRLGGGRGTAAGAKSRPASWVPFWGFSPY